MNMSNFIFLDLDSETRSLMQSEVNEDIQKERLFISERLNELGRELYPDFLKSAIKSGDEVIFKELLESGSHFNTSDFRLGKPIKMASNASQLLAQSEFNRFYIRAICLKAIEHGIENVEIYRARESSWARPESEARIGITLNAKSLLEDLRDSIGEEPKYLPDINSGLSVKLT